MNSETTFPGNPDVPTASSQRRYISSCWPIIGSFGITLDGGKGGVAFGDHTVVTTGCRALRNLAFTPSTILRRRAYGVRSFARSGAAFTLLETGSGSCRGCNGDFRPALAIVSADLALRALLRRFGIRGRFGGPAPAAAGRQPGQREADDHDLRETLEGMCKGRVRHFTQHRSLSLPGGAGCRRLQGAFVSSSGSGRAGHGDAQGPVGGERGVVE